MSGLFVDANNRPDISDPIRCDLGGFLPDRLSETLTKGNAQDQNAIAIDEIHIKLW